MTISEPPSPSPVHPPHDRSRLHPLGRGGAGFVVLALVVGFLAGRAYQHWRPGPSTITVLRGEASIVTGFPDEGDRVAIISFDGRPVSGRPIDPFFTQNFEVGNVHWFGDGTWHESGMPTCLSRERPSIVDLGVVEADTYKDAPGHVLLSWISCSPR